MTRRLQHYQIYRVAGAVEYPYRSVSAYDAADALSRVLDAPFVLVRSRWIGSKLIAVIRAHGTETVYVSRLVGRPTP